MLHQFQRFLGPQRSRILLLLFLGTGLGNLILNVIVNDVTWARDVQTALVGVFIVGAIVIIGGRLDPFDRGRWAAILAPAVIAILVAVLAAPDYLGLALGAAFGWIVAGLFLFKVRGPMEYKEAVKHLRKNKYAEAVKTLDNLIKIEPENPQHYRFRAEILRIWGKLDRARRDYEMMTKTAQDDGLKAVAYNGLAEVQLQAEQYKAAKEAALTAYNLAPKEWVAAYNLGMIEDRLHDSEAAIEHLEQALAARVPDVRHRLLIHFYRARAYARLGQMDAAHDAVKALKRHRSGLDEWQTILQSDQAETLRAVLEDDIKLAGALANDEITVDVIANRFRTG